MCVGVPGHDTGGGRRGGVRPRAEIFKPSRSWGFEKTIMAGRVARRVAGEQMLECLCDAHPAPAKHSWRDGGATPAQPPGALPHASRLFKFKSTTPACAGAFTPCAPRPRRRAWPSLLTLIVRHVSCVGVNLHRQAKVRDLGDCPPAALAVGFQQHIAGLTEGNGVVQRFEGKQRSGGGGYER
jgi:hypothetical protein